jgi:hypothetical protein
MQEPEEVKFLTPKQLRQRWSVSDNTLRKWRMHETGPAFIKIGDGPCAQVRYPLDAVEAYEKARYSWSPDKKLVVDTGI